MPYASWSTVLSKEAGESPIPEETEKELKFPTNLPTTKTSETSRLRNRLVPLLPKSRFIKGNVIPAPIEAMTPAA